jgi:hypothetical protein
MFKSDLQNFTVSLYSNSANLISKKPQNSLRRSDFRNMEKALDDNSGLLLRQIAVTHLKIPLKVA